MAQSVEEMLAELRSIDTPTIIDSVSGVSITRSSPKASCRPAVARNTPPNLPTSSPSSTTRSSARIARCRASLTAWMKIGRAHV